jgi:glycosyltransferase involved in cell wall biosynthesis
MALPKISVVIPTYNGKDHLGDAIRSVLGQTYSNFEIIVVDDASPEDASYVTNVFSDTRLRYVRHEKNKGAVAARKTGVQESTGDIVAFLDQDDLFHEKKLEIHVAYFLKHPEIGMTYNNRFEMIGTEKTICGVYRSPAVLKLADWVLGFPVSPSDAVLRREWAVRDEIWDDSFASQAEHVIFNGQEIVFGGRLALAGCKFGNVGRALNYRRYHPYRVQKYLAERCNAELMCQEIIFSDPRCPQDVLVLKYLAAANINLMWAYTAYIQEEYELGKRFLIQALDLHPRFFAGDISSPFLNTWLSWISAGTVDYVREHAEIVRLFFENLPEQLRPLSKTYDWAVARSYLLKGLHTMIWGREDQAERKLLTAIEQGAHINEAAQNMVSDELLNYEAELGSEAAQKIIERLFVILSKADRMREAKTLVGFYTLNRAFRKYHAGVFKNVPADVITAVRMDYRHLLNKGVLSIFFRSLLFKLKAKGIAQE